MTTYDVFMFQSGIGRITRLDVRIFQLIYSLNEISDILYEPNWTPFWRSNEPASNVQEEKIKLIYRLSASTMSDVCTSPWRRAWRGRAVVTRDLNIWHFRTCLGLSAFELDDTWPGLRKQIIRSDLWKTYKGCQDHDQRTGALCTSQIDSNISCTHEAWTDIT